MLGCTPPEGDTREVRWSTAQKPAAKEEEVEDTFKNREPYQ